MVPPYINNGDIKGPLLVVAQSMTTHMTRDIRPRLNTFETTMYSRLRDFVSMNPLIFLGSKVGEDPQDFLDAVYKVLSTVWVNFREKAELDSYQLREVSHVWYTQWSDNRPLDRVEWEEFMEAFLKKYFPCEMTEVKVEHFIKLKKCNMSVEEYSFKITLFSTYVPSLVSNPRNEITRFMTGVADIVNEE